MSNPSSSDAEAEAKYRYVDMPGVRFVPTDEELILDYLRKKLDGKKQPTGIVQDADVYGEHPKELTSRLGDSVEGFWYVFTERKRKYPKGTRPSRSTGTDGRWKTVGQNGKILGANNNIIGHKCELAYEVFVHDDDQSQVQGSKKRSRPRLEKTEWKMCEFVAENTDRPISPATDGRDPMLLNEWVLCQISRKTSEPSSENEDDEQAPLVEEPYEEDEEMQDTPPDDPSQQAQDFPEDGTDGSDGTPEVGTQGCDAYAQPPCDGDGLEDVQMVNYFLHPDVWENGDECGDHEAWNVHENQLGATADPEPIQFKMPVDPESTMAPLEEVPAEPESWDIAKYFFSDESVKSADDAGKENTPPPSPPPPAAAAAAAKKKTSSPATASVK